MPLLNMDCQDPLCCYTGRSDHEVPLSGRASASTPLELLGEGRSRIEVVAGKMVTVSQSVFSTPAPLHPMRYLQEHQNSVSFSRCAGRVLLYTICSRFDGILARVSLELCAESLVLNFFATFLRHALVCESFTPVFVTVPRSV